jgi:hypothetical protein
MEGSTKREEFMNIHTHQKIDQDLCGVPLIVENSYSKVQLYSHLTTWQLMIPIWSTADLSSA